MFIILPGFFLFWIFLHLKQKKLRFIIELVFGWMLALVLNFVAAVKNAPKTVRKANCLLICEVAFQFRCSSYTSTDTLRCAVHCNAVCVYVC